MSPAFESVLPAAAGATEPALSIVVVFTTAQATLPALKEAGRLAAAMAARITLVVPQVVPYPLPLTSPPVLLDWSERRFRLIAAESAVETTVRLYLCRDRAEALASALAPHSLVVIGAGRRRWPFGRETALARKLRRAGHDVIVTETE